MKLYEATAWDKYGYETHMFIKQTEDNSTVCVETVWGDLCKVPLCVFRVAEVYLNVPLYQMAVDISEKSIYIYSKNDKKRHGRILYKVEAKEF